MANPIPGPAYGMFSVTNGHTPQSGPYSIAHLSSTANNFQAASSSVNSASTSSTHITQFKVPAHKHAHHLHSIPPREKSTRTLIIDHMLWVHARTRFAQARAELGMTDRTGGTRSHNYAHRHRPENYEEDEEIGSDGEDVSALKTRAGARDHDPYNDDEDERLRTQDLPLARDLRLRAESVEKVVLSMLDQPPPLLPVSEDAAPLSAPSSPDVNPNQRTGKHPHILPDGVRLRLALGTVINDLFARHSSHSTSRHATHAVHTPSEPLSARTSPSQTFHDLSTTLPSALNCLSHISAYSPLVPGYNQANYPPKTPIKPNARTHALYRDGADPNTANSPPSLRCSRHLHTACEICVEAKAPVRVVSRGRSSSAGQPSDRSSRTRLAPTWKGTTAGMSPDGGNITGWQDGSGIGSGLARSASIGNVLRRKVSDEASSPPGTGHASVSTNLVTLIPRFLRLSALVASELGRELREEAGLESPPPLPQPSDNDAYGGKSYGELSPLPPPASASSLKAIEEAQNKFYGTVLRPTRQWYMLLAGLLTRAALEGYLTGEWRGAHAVECLLTVGLGIIEGRMDDKVDKEYGDFEPDELPSLSDAARMLFPSLRPGAPLRKGDAEADFEMEMDERLRRFYDIPLSTHDLSTHMEDLAWQFPAQPVERAAVRFCEAIAKWRGKPELETYKKKPGMTMEMFVPQPPQPSVQAGSLPPRLRTSAKKPDIGIYFREPFSAMGGWKRTRDLNDEGSAGPSAKRMHI